MDGRDYSRPGWYFVTLGANYHKHLFGNVTRGEMHPNELGQLVQHCWEEIPQHYNHIELGAWQIMPNHFHGLVRITRPGGKGLGEVMNVFKGAVTRQWRRKSPVISRYSEKGPPPAKVWAPNYYDVICFNANEYHIRERYIWANPKRWALRDVPKGIIQNKRYQGNVRLLEYTGPRYALHVSRRTTDAEMTRIWAEMLAFNGLVISTFFSPGERACLDALLQTQTKLVWIQPMAMPEKIPVKWTDAFLESRALWLSAFPEGLQNATRSTCLQANEWVRQLCSK
jgi:REP element-mobilizing transposase RayT